jgi:hypothetical protein
MPNISEQHLRATLETLTAVPAALVAFLQAELRMAVSVCVTPKGLPSVKEVYSAFTQLPADHPLKKEFNPETVQRGYNLLSSHTFKFDVGRNYLELRNHITLN